MVLGIKFQLNESLYSRDPQNTDLGQKILEHSIIMIDSMGIEVFTFKKLAKKIGSTEASIYRYFDNKHTLLLYLTSWYWEWVHYLIKINTMNITDGCQKMSIIIQNIVNATSESPLTSYVNEHLLHKIIIQESSKAYHTHSVDAENKTGVFLSYKELVNHVSEVIGEVNSDFPYKNSLASNLFEMASNQMYFAQHLPRLTDLSSSEGEYDELQKMLEFFVFKLLK